MSKYGYELGILDKMLMAMAVGAFILLGVAFAQPAWRGDDMLRQMRANCDKVGGVMLESKGMFGSNYQCSPRFDNGRSQPNEQ